MTYQPDDEIEQVLRRHSSFEPKPKRSKAVIVVPTLALIGIASGFAWYYANDLKDLSSLVSSGSPASSAALASKFVALKDFQAFQQQNASQLQNTAQQMDSLRVELKLLSDQAAVLTSKINDLGTSAPPAAVQISPAQRATTKSAIKKPAAQLAPVISTGGAPLPLASPKQ